MRKLACLLFAAIAISACGKKGPLIYPDLLVPAAPSGVSAQQFGNSIKLSFVLPSKDLAGRNFAGLSGVSIIKRDEPAGQSPGCSACTTDFSPFRKLNLDLLPPDTRRYGNLLVLLDGAVQTGRAYSYRVSAVTIDNQDGALSAPGTAVMVPVPLPPVLQAISQPTEIQLRFTAVPQVQQAISQPTGIQLNVTAVPQVLQAISHPTEIQPESTGVPPGEGVIAGYNVYRALKGEAFPFQPLNREPLAGNSYTDVGLERGTTYIYGARTVVRLPSGGRVEGSLSNEAEGRLKNDE